MRRSDLSRRSVHRTSTASSNHLHGPRRDCRRKSDRGSRSFLGGGSMTKKIMADDFPLVRDGFAAALSRDPTIRVVGFAVDGMDALEKTRALKPDVLLLDLRMPRMSGLMALTQLTAELPSVRVLVVSDLACDDSVVDAVAAGAAGFISKHITGPELCDAIHAVKRGEAAISPDLLGHLMRGLRREPGGG